MQIRAIIGIVLTLAGIASFGAGGVVLKRGLDDQASNSARITRSDVACREQLVQLGQVIPRENDMIEVRIGDPDNEDGLADPRAALADVTAALAMCPGRELVDACIGVGCGEGDVDIGPISLNMRLGLVR